jgi:hypothetical protein
VPTAGPRSIAGAAKLVVHPADHVNVTLVCCDAYIGILAVSLASWANGNAFCWGFHCLPSFHGSGTPASPRGSLVPIAWPRIAGTEAILVVCTFPRWARSSPCSSSLAKTRACCSKIAEAEAAVSVNKENWLKQEEQ